VSILPALVIKKTINYAYSATYTVTKQNIFINRSIFFKTRVVNKSGIFFFFTPVPLILTLEYPPVVGRLPRL